MPHHKSAEKRVLTNELARRRNVALRSRMRASLKTVREATTRTQALAACREASAILDRTAAKGVIRKETASRHKGRLAKFAASLPA